MENYRGYINLMKLNGVQFLTVNGKPSLVIPVGMNDIRVEKNDQTGAMSATIGVKADAVGDRYREVERQNHQHETGWDESKLTSHQLIRTYSKDYRDKLFARVKEMLRKDNSDQQIIDKMSQVLRRDGSEGMAALDNKRGWDKLCWQELDRRSRIGRLSVNEGRNIEVRTSQAVQAEEYVPDLTTAQDYDDLPF
ncbi:MAG: hypothetical protein IJ557_02710 [Bacteroidaceae bacterium]|nr:hypothetical protein [Bacteroidaceae bacterium]